MLLPREIGKRDAPVVPRRSARGSVKSENTRSPTRSRDHEQNLKVVLVTLSWKTNATTTDFSNFWNRCSVMYVTRTYRTRVNNQIIILLFILYFWVKYGRVHCSCKIEENFYFLNPLPKKCIIEVLVRLYISWEPLLGTDYIITTHTIELCGDGGGGDDARAGARVRTKLLIIYCSTRYGAKACS